MPKRTSWNNRECHKCRYNGKGDKHCLSCKGPAEISGKGISMVYPDGEEYPEGIYAQQSYIPNQNQSNGVTAKLTSDVEAALVPILANLLALSDMDMAILKRKYNGLDGAQIARELKTSKQVIHIHIKRLCEEQNPIARAIAGMKRAGIGGAKRGVMRSGLVQPELFAEGHA